jgi:uncharacterized protein
MNRMISLKATARAVALGFGLAAIAAPALIVTTSAALADPAADKAIVDQAKAAGTVGEQGDGYLGFVNGSADGSITAAVNAINAGRRAVYAQTAAKSGVSPEAAAQATGTLLIGKVAPGQYYKPMGGGWTKR